MKVNETIVKKNAFIVAMNQIKSTRISDEKMRQQAKDLGLSFEAAKKAYENVTISAVPSVDRRVKYEDGYTPIATLEANKAAYAQNSRDKYMKATHGVSKNVTPSEAAKIIIDVMNSDKRVWAVLVENGITYNAYYKWLWELEVYGTLLGRKVLDFKKFNKYPVVDMIRIKKYPNGSINKNKSLLEISNLYRVSTILENKLTILANKKSI